MSASDTDTEGSAAATLTACIVARWKGVDPHPGVDTPSSEQLADRLLAMDQLHAAAESYAALASDRGPIRAKRGWCLIWLGQVEEGRPLLEPEPVGASSAELVARAVALAGGWSGSQLSRGGFSATKQERADSEKRRRDVLDLLKQAIEADPPDPNAFDLFQRFSQWYLNSDTDTLALVDAWLARTGYIGLRLWRALLFRRMRQSTRAIVDDLLAHEPADPDATYFEELLASARDCGAFDVAQHLLQVLYDAIANDFSSQGRHDLALVRADVAVEASRAGVQVDIAAARRELAEARSTLLVEQAARDISASRELDLSLAVAENRVQVGNDTEVAQAVEALFDVLSSTATYAGFDAIENASPVHIEAPSLFRGRMLMELRTSPIDDAASVHALLSGSLADRWRLATLIHHFEREEEFSIEDSKALLALAEHDPPPYAHESLTRAILDLAPSQAGQAGLHFASALIFAAQSAMPIDDAIVPESLANLDAQNLASFSDNMLTSLRHLDPAANLVPRSAVLNMLSSHLVEKKLYLQLQNLAEDAESLDPSTSAHFYAGYAAQMLNERESARIAYEMLLAGEPKHHSAARNLVILLDQQRDLARIQNYLPHIATMAAEQPNPWAATLKLAREAEARAKAESVNQSTREHIRAALSAFPPLSSNIIAVGDLSLVDAAHLIALLRACDIDHATWTLRAFGRSSIPFDPTNFMRGALLTLAELGVVSISESSPLSAFKVDSTREVSYFLDRVEWRVGPATLHLAEQIRGLPRAAWPPSWQERLSVVARDLAVEECVAYVEHLAEERNLTTPERADMRVLFREMIETTAVTRCWYFIYLGVVSTNDYKSRYPASKDRIATHMLNRIREKWERGMREGWGKEYGRPSALPRSQIAAALHDVLTGWGERAFEHILAELTIEHEEADTPLRKGTIH